MSLDLSLKAEQTVIWVWGPGLYSRQGQGTKDILIKLNLIQKLNKHYLDLGLALRLLQSLEVAETKDYLLVAWVFISLLIRVEVAVGLLQNTATSKTEVDVSMWKTQGLLHFDNSLILLLKLKAQ